MNMISARRPSATPSVDRRLSTVSDSPPLLCPGRNCWATPIADRASVLIDGAAYFQALEAAFSAARQSIIIVGWDFDGSIPLRPDRPDDPLPLGPFLRTLVERRPELEVRILVWSLSILHAPGAIGPLLLGSEWQDHPRIRLKLDTEHPVYAAHHQKIVCVDDATAFVGGIDLTVGRWDSMQHRCHDDRRCNDAGAAYGPVHDVQMHVEGEAASHVADIARERWRVATGETPPRATLPPLNTDAFEPCDFRRAPVAVVRTAPPWKGAPPRREAAALTRDLLLGARDFAYIEAQYLTARYVGAALKYLLERAEGPEIVVILRRESEGFLEQRFMAENRDRLLRRLKASDRHSRLRCYSPVVHGETETRHILVHSKVMIVDDRVLRIGSSNLNNRSVGLDTECDLALEARDAETRDSIARVRERLMAEHLGVTPETIAEEFARSRSLIDVVERLNGGRRALAPFEAMHTPGPTRPVWGTRIIDPEKPFRLLQPLMRPLVRLTRPRTGAVARRGET